MHCFMLLMAEDNSIVCVLHLPYPFICDWTLVCSFHVLDIVNSAAMKIEVYVSFQLKEFSGLIFKKFSLLYGQKF